MQAIDLLPETEARFLRTEERLPPEEYNFSHFRTEHFARDARATLERWGIQPGEMAPDFELPRADGGLLRLHHLRGRPVLLRFGSFT